jgi:hypothetical protein
VHPLLGFSGRPDHNPARFLDAICLGYILSWIPRTVDWKLMRLRAFRFLNLLGEHSLQVFAFSMLITRFEAHVITNLPFAAKLALTLLTVVSLILPARVHQIYRAHKSGRAHVDSLELGHPSTA